jgi:AcrR family transcriptional regulator
VPKSGSVDEISRSISVRNAAAPAPDVIEAATAMMREGRPPTVAEAAERALVSRATAYRYFPTQESLLLDVVNVEALLKPVEDLVASFPTDDAAQRLAALSTPSRRACCLMRH